MAVPRSDSNDKALAPGHTETTPPSTSGLVSRSALTASRSGEPGGDSFHRCTFSTTSVADSSCDQSLETYDHCDDKLDDSTSITHPPRSPKYRGNLLSRGCF